jgi:Mg2+ and Co2+ transporter CorA
MLRRITSINKRGIYRFMHSHMPNSTGNEINYIAWKEREEKMFEKLNKMTKQIETIEKEVKQHTEHNKKVETVGELAGIGTVTLLFIAGYWVTHIVFKFLIM